MTWYYVQDKERQGAVEQSEFETLANGGTIGVETLRYHRKYRLLGLFCPSLLLILSASLDCCAQRPTDPRPAPLDPVRGEREAQALLAELLAQRPEQNVTNTGWITITDAKGKERMIPVRFEVTAARTNWTSVYLTLPSASRPGGVKLTVTHSDEQPNRYELVDPATGAAANALAKDLTREQIMAPFARSDFWIADLGLEFLHWPRQRVLFLNEMYHGTACRVLESINPSPTRDGYARVKSWIMIASPHGIVHADAYDAHGKVLKHFDPKGFVKIEDEYELEEIEMRNLKPPSKTVIKFNPAGR